VIISLFGSIFIFIFQKHSKKKWNLTLLEYGFISFAVGMLIYILIAYILNLFKFFNFYTAFLPFLIISLAFLIYLFSIKKIQEYLTLIKNYLISNYRTVIIYIFILSFIFFLQFLSFWPKVSESSTLLSYDSYWWPKQVLHLNEYGFVNYRDISPFYSWGFIFFNGGNLLISPDFMTTYYFIKLACFPFLNFYILVMFSISKRLFKRHSLIFFCLIGVLSNSYFLYRIIMFLSSSIAVLLILISLIIIITETPNYLLGFTVPAIFLMNPVYGFYFALPLIIFYITIIIIYRREAFSNFKEIIVIMLLSVVFVIPYLISYIYFQNQNLINLIKSFAKYFNINIFNQSDAIINTSSNSLSTSPLLILFNSLSDFTFLYIILDVFYIVFVVILPIFSLFLKDKNRRKVNKYFSIFLKIGLIAYPIAFTPQIFERIRFLDIFYFRVLEALLPCFILLAGLFIERILTESSKLWQRIKGRSDKIKNWAGKDKFYNKILNLPSIMVILILGSSFFTYNYARENFNYHYHYDDSVIDCIFYINYNIERESNIAVNIFDQHHYTPYLLLYNYNLSKYQFNYNLTLAELNTFTNTNAIEYLIISPSSYNSNFTYNFYNSPSFKILAGGNNTGDFALYEI